MALRNVDFSIQLLRATLSQRFSKHIIILLLCLSNECMHSIPNLWYSYVLTSYMGFFNTPFWIHRRYVLYSVCVYLRIPNMYFMHPCVRLHISCIVKLQLPIIILYSLILWNPSVHRNATQRILIKYDIFFLWLFIFIARNFKFWNAYKEIYSAILGTYMITYAFKIS